MNLGLYRHLKFLVRTKGSSLLRINIKKHIKWGGSSPHVFHHDPPSMFLDDLLCHLCSLHQIWCSYSIMFWFIFLGKSIVWNSRLGLPWSETLARFIEYFDSKIDFFGIFLHVRSYGSFGRWEMKRSFS